MWIAEYIRHQLDEDKMGEQLTMFVFCKTEMQKVAERSCRLLQLQNVGNCRRSITDG